MKRIAILAMTAIMAMAAMAQRPKPYDESIDPMRQIDQAVATAQASGRNVICQVGGNWCRWCLMLAEFVEADAEVAQEIADNYVYIHVNYPTDGSAPALTERLGNPGRFGYPVLVVLDGQGNVLHIQDTALLESGEGYDREKVLRVLRCWAPEKD